MSGELRIAAEDLTVSRCRSPVRNAAYGFRDALRELAGRSAATAPRPSEFLALDGIDVELRAGEALAVIGANGAGKSTLVKLLAGLLTPTRGRVAVHGRAEAIIELGSGLNPLLTGRENGLLGAYLHDLGPRERIAYLDRVEEFAGIGGAFRAPVSSYSSGMKARLAFAMAAMSGPDILLIDEALAVGDHAFQRRCAAFIHDFLADGGSLVFVSHNSFQVQTLCHKGLLLDGGRTLFQGTASEAVRAMLDLQRNRPSGADGRDAKLRLVRLSGPDGGPPRTGAPAELVVEYRLDRACEDVSWGFEIWTADEQLCVTGGQDMTRRTLPAGSGELRCTIDPLPLTDGRYVLKLNLTDLFAGAPIALAGFRGFAETFDVECSPALLSNYHVQKGQLTILDVAWGD